MELESMEASVSTERLGARSHAQRCSATPKKEQPHNVNINDVIFSVQFS